MFSRKELTKLYECMIQYAESVSLYEQSKKVIIEYKLSPQIENFDQLETKKDYTFAIIFDWTFVPNRVDHVIAYSFNEYTNIFDAQKDHDEIVRDYFEVLNRVNTSVQKDEIRKQYEELIELDRKNNPRNTTIHYGGNYNDPAHDFFQHLMERNQREEEEREERRRRLRDLPLVYDRDAGPHDEPDDYDDLPF